MSSNKIDSKTEGNCLNKFKLHHFNGCRNLGDELNKDILRYIGVDYCCTGFAESNLIAIGSLLSTLSGIVTDMKPAPCPYYDCIDIWGTGFIQEKNCENEFFTKNVKIHALRGKLSKARCEDILGHKLDRIALGDPSLLTSRAITVYDVEKKYDVGFIPHYVDKDSDLLNKIKLQNKSYRIIDVQGDTRQICREICECRLILSSAMHGLIVADSYGIPNRWIRFSDNIIGGNYKFNDYYSVFNIEGLEPIDLRKEIITDQDVGLFIANYPIKKGDVERICDDLEKAFPRKKEVDFLRELNIEANSKVFRKKYMKEALKTNPLVSIIIPSYNHAIYLPETLDSVLAQTYTNWECIIVNDGSSDNTEEIARQYCKKDVRFKYIYQKNSGPATARNTGIINSKGKFILPLDSDDLISRGYLTEAVSIFEENPATKLVYCEAELFGEASGLWKLPRYSFDELLFSNMIFCTAMYKRSDYDKKTGYNPNMKEGLEDWDFWLSLLKKDDLVYQIPKVHFYCRIRNNARNNSALKNRELAKKMFGQIFSNHMALYEGKINPLYTDYLLHQKNEKLQQKDQEILHLKQTVAERDGQISRLEGVVRDKEATLNHIYNSNGWRVLVIYYKIRNKIFPMNTKRGLLAKLVFKAFTDPTGIFRNFKKTDLREFGCHFRASGPGISKQEAGEKILGVSGLTEIHPIEESEVGDDLIPPSSMVFVGDGDFKAIGEEFKGYFLEIGQLNPEDRVLDVGCGIGRMAVPLTGFLSSQGEYWGFDIVKKGIEWCQIHITPRYSNFHFLHCDVYNKAYNPGSKISAKKYRFPFENDSFDFVFLTSVFTHMIPRDMKNYLSEVSRVMKLGGRCLITFFLMTKEARYLIDVGSSTQNFKYGMGRCWTTNKETPEDAIAYDQEFILRLFKNYNLIINEPIHYGSWCGRTSFLSYQDIIVATKK